MSTIRQVIDDLLNDPRLTAQQAVDKHYAAGFFQRTNGSREDRAQLVARVGELRRTFERASVRVLDEFADGPRYAERHIIDLVRRDGGRIVQEVYVFAERDAQGRFVRIEEATVPVRDDFSAHS